MDYKQIVILVGATFLTANALLTGAGQLYYLAGVVACIPLVGYLFCRLSVGGLACERTVHDRVYDGEEVQVHLTLRHHRLLPRLGMLVEEVLPAWLEAPGPLVFYFPVLWAGRPVTVTYRVRARKRGVHLFQRVNVAVSDPVGLTQRQFAVAASGQAVVYPRPLPLAAWAPGGAVSYADAGRERLAAGQGGDFYAIREYHPGDDLRRIHWRSTARRGHLAVVEFERTQAADTLVVLDLAAGSEVGEGKLTTLETGITAAASLLQHCLRSRAAAVLVCHDRAGWDELPVRSEGEYLQALERLAAARADGPQPLAGVLAGLDRRLLERYSAVLITSVPDPELAPAVEQCLRAGSCTLVLVDPSQHQAGYPGEVGDFAASMRALGALVQVIGRPEDLAGAVPPWAREGAAP